MDFPKHADNHSLLKPPPFEQVKQHIFKRLVSFMSGISEGTSVEVDHDKVESLFNQYSGVFSQSYKYICHDRYIYPASTDDLKIRWRQYFELIESCVPTQISHNLIERLLGISIQDFEMAIVSGYGNDFVN